MALVALHGEDLDEGTNVSEVCIMFCLYQVYEGKYYI